MIQSELRVSRRKSPSSPSRKALVKTVKKPTIMTFENNKASSPLDKYFERIFYYKDFQPEHNFEKVIPIGNKFILIEFDGFEKIIKNEIWIIL